MKVTKCRTGNGFRNVALPSGTKQVQMDKKEDFQTKCLRTKMIIQKCKGASKCANLGTSQKRFAEMKDTIHDKHINPISRILTTHHNVADYDILEFNEIKCKLMTTEYQSDKDITIKIFDLYLMNENLSISNFRYPLKKLEGCFYTDSEFAMGLVTTQQLSNYSNSAFLKILDITGVTNEGLGSIVLKKAIEIAKERKCTSIKGELGSGDLLDNDKEHKPRLLHFYKKFGFQISLNSEETYGKIFLQL